MKENKINELVDLMFSFDNKELEKEIDFLKEYKELKEKYNSILLDCVRLREEKIKYKKVFDKLNKFVNETCKGYQDVDSTTISKILEEIE